MGLRETHTKLDLRDPGHGEEPDISEGSGEELFMGFELALLVTGSKDCK